MREARERRAGMMVREADISGSEIESGPKFVAEKPK